MEVSVVVCEHDVERWGDCRDAAESVLAQTYPETQLVLVSDGSDAVCTAMTETYGDHDDVVIECLDENVGLLEARNAGAEAATGAVVAFLDDDAIADDEWVAELAAIYTEHDVPAVGGKMTPAWIAGEPRFLPPEFHWLVGVTHAGFADGPGEVRNTFGSNISFRRDVFLELGGFDADIGGRQGDANLQGGETELCARLQAEYGYGVYYTPDAEVAHKVFDYRTDLRWLLDRAFWQGYSKRAMAVLVPRSTGAESAFLTHLITSAAPRRLRSLVSRPSTTKLLRFVMLFVFTAAVGAGYAYGFLRWR
ncbi:MAG: glucosyl-dolichyl phosphate glucuronosyltransferase [Salinirussus sp.]